MNICTIEGCINPVHGNGLCSTHYMRNRRIKPVDACIIKGCHNKSLCKKMCSKHYQASKRKKKKKPICRFRECGRKHYANGLCNKHYHQEYYIGKLVEEIRNDNNVL